MAHAPAPTTAPPPNVPAPSYLDPQTLASIQSIELRARMVVEGLMTGMHRSPQQGVSVEFAQHRQYTPGDDTRHLDWKVFGRTDKLYLKQYQKETNLDLVVLMDASGSMAYTSLTQQPGGFTNNWRKYDHAACIAAAIAYLALKQQDRVGLTVFDENSRQVTRMSNSQGHYASVCKALFDATPQGSAQINHRPDAETFSGTTDLARLFDETAAKLSRRSLVVLLSDLLGDPDALDAGLAKLRFRRHDVLVMQVMDPAELEFPFRGPSDFIGLENEGRLPLDPASLRKAYLDAVEQHLTAVRQACRKHRFDHVLLNTRDVLGPPLSHFLARRSSMIGKRG